jgi:hypothetical protein
MEITANGYIMNDGTLGSFYWPSGVASKKEIDYFLALNEINMPLAIVGTEAVWYDASKAIEFSSKDALVFFPSLRIAHGWS